MDYKLAPEYQWPTQIEETEFVVRRLFKHASERGLDPSRIGLGGDSAGGNITCTVCLKLRDENGPKLALQMPIYFEAEMLFFTRASVENVSGGMWIQQASCSLYGASCRRASTTHNSTSRP